MTAEAAHGKDDHDLGDHMGGKGAWQAGTASTAPAKGPHGGKLFTRRLWPGIEHLRIRRRARIPRVTSTGTRQGRPANERRSFVTLWTAWGALPRPSALPLRKDYLRARRPSKPHSFAATVKAQAGDQTYEFKFEQVEARSAGQRRAAQSETGSRIGTAGPAPYSQQPATAGRVKLNQDRSVFVTPRLTGLVGVRARECR